MSNQQKLTYKHSPLTNSLVKILGSLHFIFTIFRTLRRYSGRTRKAKVVILHKDKILLVKNITEPTTWTIPGGALKHKETTKSAATREVYEELGIKLSKKHLREVATLTPNDTSLPDTYSIFSQSIERPPAIKLGFEIVEAAWFKPEDIPPDTYFVHHPLIAHCFKEGAYFKHQR